MKKTFAVYGNCQASPIAKLLLNNQTFAEQFELVNFSQPVFMLKNSDWPHVYEVVSKVDLLICQSVGNAFGEMLSTENLFKHTKSSALKVSFPSIYFNGYFTEVDYLRGMPASINSFSDYHDLNIVNNFLETPDIEQAKQKSLAQINDPHYYSTQSVEQGVSRSLLELRSREATLDIQVADFIESNWAQQQLFFSVNHPSRKLLLDVCDQILTLLEVQDKTIPGNYEHLGETILPLYQSVQNVMNAEQLPPLKVKGKQFTVQEYVNGLVSIYQQHDSAKLQQTLEFIKQKRER